MVSRIMSRRALVYVPTMALFAGLVFDIFTLNRPDALFENAVILFYLSVSVAAMLALQAQLDGDSDVRRLLFLGALQFSFGNLASALMVLYARSGTLAGTAIFVGMLAALFLGNEFLKTRYARTHLRVIIFFILLLTYATLIVPVLLNSISVWVFFVSLATALVLTFALVRVLRMVSKQPLAQSARHMSRSIVLAALVFVGLYFAQLIPPVPLALKHIGIYHFVVRDAGSYVVQFEDAPWYAFWRDTNSTYTHTPGNLGYCLTAVFAPAGLTTRIQHRWERYNPDADAWETAALIPFELLGGRDEGFRGYTQTTQLREGRWRCGVETSRGVLIGREEFTVVESPTPPLLETDTL